MYVNHNIQSGNYSMSVLYLDIFFFKTRKRFFLLLYVVLYHQNNVYHGTINIDLINSMPLWFEFFPIKITEFGEVAFL